MHHRDDSEEVQPRPYRWQKGQWCPPGLRKSQKRRVQRLRNRELEEAAANGKKQEWRPKEKPDDADKGADVAMTFFLPLEFMAPAGRGAQDQVYSDSDEDEHDELAAQLVLSQKAAFDKPAKHRHLKPLYVKGYVNGKPLTKMFVDGGAAINIMP